MTHRVDYRRYALPFRAPVRTAHGVWSVREGLLIRAVTADGRVGYGEAAPIPGFGRETVDAAEVVLQTLGGEWTPERAAGIPGEFGALRHALHAATEPSAPTGAREHLPVAALLPAGRAVLERIDALAEAGFRTFKWKVGVLDAADEWAILDDLLARLPEGARLRLDANGAWDRRGAERWLSRCAERPVEYVEQPVAADLPQAEDWLHGLAEDYPTPIALDESLVGGDDLERWLGGGWRGVYVLKPSLLANPAGAVASLAAAKAAVVFSSALETAVGARHALQLALAWPGETDPTGRPRVRALGFGVWPLFADPRMDGPALAPFVRRRDVEALNPEAVWTALS